MPFRTQVQPYLFFDGHCEEAIEFYRKALGAELIGLMRFKDSPAGMTPPGAPDKVMHASFRVGETTMLASDGRCEGRPSFQALRYRSRSPTRPRPSGGSHL